MTVEKICQLINGKLLSGTGFQDNLVHSGYACDLLSVVMGKAKEGCAWITIQSHINIVAVALLINAACIIVSEGFEVEEEAVLKAHEENIPIITSDLSTYEIVAILSKEGVC